MKKPKQEHKSKKLRTRIVDGGEDFGDLAKRYSADQGSARLNGNLGNHAGEPSYLSSKQQLTTSKMGKSLSLLKRNLVST